MNNGNYYKTILFLSILAFTQCNSSNSNMEKVEEKKNVKNNTEAKNEVNNKLKKEKNDAQVINIANSYSTLTNITKLANSISKVSPPPIEYITVIDDAIPEPIDYCKIYRDSIIKSEKYKNRLILDDTHTPKNLIISNYYRWGCIEDLYRNIEFHYTSNMAYIIYSGEIRADNYSIYEKHGYRYHIISDTNVIYELIKELNNYMPWEGFELGYNKNYAEYVSSASGSGNLKFYLNQANGLTLEKSYDYVDGSCFFFPNVYGIVLPDKSFYNGNVLNCEKANELIENSPSQIAASYLIDNRCKINFDKWLEIITDSETSKRHLELLLGCMKDIRFFQQDELRDIFLNKVVLSNDYPCNLEHLDVRSFASLLICVDYNDELLLTILKDKESDYRHERRKQGNNN